MSSKKLFDSQKINDALVSTSLEEEVVKNAPELESADNVREQIERVNRFIPHVEFNDPNNFAYYGSAKAYYEDAITRITNTFPYDGSEEEITRFHNESNYLDKYIFDKKYPRTTGYAKFAIADDPDATAIAISDFRASDAINVGWTVGASTVEYIKFFGGPHTASNGMSTGTLATSFTGSNLYDTSIYSTDGTLALDRVGSRESNLKFKLTDGVTTEFWLNLDSDWPNQPSVTDLPANQVIYDQWNGAASSSAGYGRLMIFVTGAKGHSLLNGSNPIGVHLASGSNVWDIQFGGSTFTTGSLKDTWNHIALSFVSSSTNIEANFYLNGKLHETKTNTSLTSFGEVTGSMIGYLGAGQTAVSGAKAAGVTSMSNPFCPLSGSLDEFRYWKSERTEKEIQQNYWTHVRGGTNNEIANAELGVYFKFNEGITGDTTIDSKVLDYSGRITNGTWVNYPGSAARNTGSAIVSASAAPSEYADPIIYDTHTDVKTLFSDLSTTGSVYDHQNQTSLMDSMPGWIRDDEDENGAGELERLTQIVGSYFDTLQLQVQNLPKLKDNTYLSSSFKPTPFTNRMLSSAGLHVPEIFVDATLLERFANRNADEEYASDINEIKSTIYQNIYNNLIYIYKSKGTEKAFRNLMHCYGISDDVIQFNAYGNNTTFKLEDTRQSTVVRKNYVDFNDPKRWTGTVFQNSASIGHWTSDTTYVSGTNKNFANTAEIEVMFPRQRENSDPEFFHTGFLSSSIFGHHMAAQNGQSFAFDGTPGNDKNYQLYAVRTDYNSKDAYFVLKDRAENFSLVSPVYSNVYDNQKWNFAVRVKDAKWPQGDGMSGDDPTPVFFPDDDIQIELYGVNVDAGVVRNEFTLTKTDLADEYLTDRRRYYVGADRTNFKSTVITNSDIQASSFRFYTTYLDDSVIKAHALDPENYGTKSPTQNTVFGVNSSTYTNDNHTFNEAVSLAINWDFSEVTTADSIGEFSVQDASSGSVSLRTRYDNDENLSHIVGNQYYAQGYFPDSTATAERSKVISKQYVQSERQNLPEVVSTSDAVNVLSRDDEFFPRDPAVSQTFFAFEKSMYGIISQEMLKMFSTIVEFNDLIGDLTNKYREDYKGLRLLRHLFFEKIENSPDLDKFIDYYKWIDSSLSIFLQQLVPASANVSDEIRVMVEDHILGRSKYRHQYPHLDYKGNERWGGDEAKLEARVKRFAELDYNWQFGHAPVNMGLTAATATIQFSDAGALADGETFIIVDAGGVSHTFTIEDSNDVVTGNKVGIQTAKATGGLSGQIAAALQFAASINNAASTASTCLGKISASAALTSVILIQATKGTAGNQANDDSSTAGFTVSDFSGGTDNEPKNSLWWKERAERDGASFLTSDGTATSTVIDNARRDLNDIILSFNSGSAELLNTGAGATGTYLGSAYATRRFTRPLKLTADIVNDIGGGYNYPRGHKPDALFALLPGLVQDSDGGLLQIEKKGTPDIASEELRPVMKQYKRAVPGVYSSEIDLAGDDITGTKYLTPFIAYSSSVSNTQGDSFGYKWQSNLEGGGGGGSNGPDATNANREFSGYHNDSYGAEYEVPMQGPFTNQHVGGNRHRHTDLNTGSVADRKNTRPEAWALVTPENKTKFIAARNSGFGSAQSTGFNTNPQYRRDQTAKRPVNIKNIKHRTGSMGLVAGGNFNKRYEIVQTSDRSLNNSYFVKSEGFSTASITPSTDAYVDGLTDYAKPVRGRTEHVIVERFSAPGDPATAGDSSGGPGMDYEAGQFSPYNNLNYRNLSVREPLQTLLTERSEQFGLRSGTSVQAEGYVVNITASYHKINRNGAKRVGYPPSEVSNETGRAVYLTSSFDNYHVQHMIPRTDYQYAWITASYVSTNNELYGYLPYSGLVSASAGDGVSGIMISAINFATASHAGIAVNDSGVRTTASDTARINKARAVNAIDTTGLSGPGDTSFSILIPTSAGGEHDSTATIILLDADQTTSPAAAANTIAVGAQGLTNAAAAAAIIAAINGDTASGAGSLVDLATSGVGQNGVVGITAEEGSSNTQITLINNVHGAAGNIINAITLVGGSTIIDNRNFHNGGSFVPTSFVNMNTTIVEPLSASSLTTGYPLSTHPAHYYNHKDLGITDSSLLNAAAFGAYVQKVGNVAGAKTTIATTLQNLNSHRGNVFGYPTWKQIRVGNTQMARHLRKSNLYTHTFPSTGDLVVKDKQGGDLTIRPRFGETMIVSQSVVTDRYLPMVFDLEMKTGKTRRGQELTTPVIIQSTYANGLVKFENKEFANKLGLEVDFRNSPYKQIRKMYTRGALNDPSSPITAVNRVIYKEVVYPSLANAQTNKTRGRTNYLNNFWRTERTDRSNITASLHATKKLHPAGTKDKPNNTSQMAVNQSIWSLDAPESFAAAGSQLLHATGGIKANNDEAFRPGELQNNYVHFMNRIDPDDTATLIKGVHRRPGILYARKHIFPATASVAPAWGMRSRISLKSQHGTVPVVAVDRACMSTASIGLGEAAWDAPNMAGRYEGTSSIFVTRARTPFDDGYDEWFANIKAPGQGYSIVPEFRITDHLDFYRNKSGGDFLTDNLKALQIIGTPSGTTTPQNSDEDNFYTTYTNSDFLKYFEVVKKDHKGLINPASLTLKCRAIKKFIPYDGFYPAERTIQMAQAFSQSYASWIAYDGTDAGVASAFNTFTKPLFGPGILYNTIKAGLAVDYPIMTGSFRMTASHLYDANADALYHEVASYAIASNSTSASYYGPKTNETTAFPRHANYGIGTHSEGWDYRVPFEALVQPEKYLTNRPIVHDEPSPHAAQDVTASWAGYRNDNKYRDMMHNFLAESISFFLKNGRTTQIVSKPQSEWEPVTPGQPYGMRIKLYRSMSGSSGGTFLETGLHPELANKTVPQTSGAWGQFSVPQNIPGQGESDFEMYSRPSAFGPAVSTTSGRDNILAPYSVTGALEFGPAQGVYASHTPPYYDGESWVDIIYYPAREIEEFDSDTAQEDNILSIKYADSAEPFVPTLDDIFGLAAIAPSGSSAFTPGNSTALSKQEARFGGKGTYVVKWRFDQEALRASPEPLLSTYDMTHRMGVDRNTGGVALLDNRLGWVGPMAGPYANRWCMQGDASLNLFGQKGDQWKISTKFETPMLNFRYVKEEDITRQTTDPPGATAAIWNQTIPRGMWHQFGRIPTGSQGVYLQVTDIPDNWLENHPASHIMFDPVGKFDLRNRFSGEGMVDPFVSGFASLPSTHPTGSAALVWKEALTGYRFPIGGSSMFAGGTANAVEGMVTPRPKSLIDICGFDTEQVRVGKIRQKKFVHEAVVAVPYVEQDGERKFFNIMSPDSSAFDSFVGKSVHRQVRLMEKYVFPPAMDFVHNEGVPPIAMYIFEFKHKFDTDDLSHIWQNLPPRTGVKGEYATSTFTHTLKSNQLLADHTEGLAEAADDDTTGIYHSGLPENLQWMVFKVKQRAHKDYFEKIGIKELEETNTVTTSKSFIDEDGTPTTISESSTTTTKVPYESEIPFYTDNWPYDHFSLVELLKVEAHVTFAKTIEKPKSAIESLESGEVDKEDAVVQTGTPTGGVSSSLTGLNKN